MTAALRMSHSYGPLLLPRTAVLLVAIVVAIAVLAGIYNANRMRICNTTRQTAQEIYRVNAGPSRLTTYGSPWSRCTRAFEENSCPFPAFLPYRLPWSTRLEPLNPFAAQRSHRPDRCRSHDCTLRGGILSGATISEARCVLAHIRRPAGFRRTGYGGPGQPQPPLADLRI